MSATQVRLAVEDAFRDFETAGVPSSGEHEPVKAEIRHALGELLEATLSSLGAGLLRFPTRAALYAATSEDEGQLAYVYADSVAARNTVYQWSGTAWVIADWYFSAVAAVVQPLVDEAEAAQVAAEAAQVAAELASARFSITAPAGPLVEGESPVRELRDDNGRLVEAVTVEGSHFVSTPGGLVRVSAERGASVPNGPLLDGMAPIYTRSTLSGQIVEAVTPDGGRYIATDEGLTRTAPLPELPRKYVGPNWEAGFGLQQVARAPAEDGVWHLFFVLGQSTAMGQNAVTGDALVAVTPLYPDNALMFAGGPRRDDALPNRDLVPLIESVSPSGGQRETCASGWANHFIRDVEAETSVRPRVLAVVTALGSTPLMQLSRGTPTYANFLRAVEDAVEAIRERGGRRIVTHVAWLQGQSDNGGVGNMTSARRLRNLQTFSRHVRADIMARTGEVEPCPFFIIAQSGQPFADPWFAPVRDADVAADGLDDMRLAGTDYFLPYVDLLHYTCAGQNAAGQMLARASVSESMAQGSRAVKPVGHRWTGATTFVVDFDVPQPPLVLDSSGAVISTAGLSASGFTFDDGSGSPPAISAIAVTTTGPWAGLALQFTLTAAPTGPFRRLGYAIRRDASQSGAYPGQAG